ncbi:MAG: hypothetical protein JST00_05005 [Deltaproteobacteria bacterium]|nr:hypothetical protein [Deltaproteobacteria bacterium]
MTPSAPGAQAPVCSAPAEAPRPPAVPASPAVTVNDPEAAIARLFTSKTLDPGLLLAGLSRAK